MAQSDRNCTLLPALVKNFNAAQTRGAHNHEQSDWAAVEAASKTTFCQVRVRNPFSIFDSSTFLSPIISCSLPFFTLCQILTLSLSHTQAVYSVVDFIPNTHSSSIVSSLLHYAQFSQVFPLLSFFQQCLCNTSPTSVYLNLYQLRYHLSTNFKDKQQVKLSLTLHIMFFIWTRWLADSEPELFSSGFISKLIHALSVWFFAFIVVQPCTAGTFLYPNIRMPSQGLQQRLGRVNISVCFTLTLFVLPQTSSCFQPLHSLMSGTDRKICPHFFLLCLSRARVQQYCAGLKNLQWVGAISNWRDCIWLAYRPRFDILVFLNAV